MYFKSEKNVKFVFLNIDHNLTQRYYHIKYSRLQHFFGQPGLA